MLYECNRLDLGVYICIQYVHVYIVRMQKQLMKYIIYTCIYCMYAKAIDETEAVTLKESMNGYMGGSGWRKWKGQIL